MMIIITIIILLLLLLIIIITKKHSNTTRSPFTRSILPTLPPFPDLLPPEVLHDPVHTEVDRQDPLHRPDILVQLLAQPYLL